LLRRAQSRPPRARGDAGGSRQLTLRRIVLSLLAAHRGGQLPLRVEYRTHPSRPHGPESVELAERHRAGLRADRGPPWYPPPGLRPVPDPLPGDPGNRRLLGARGGQLPRALRPPPPAPCRRAVRAHFTGTLLEQQPAGDEHLPLPAAAALRS